MDSKLHFSWDGFTASDLYDMMEQPDINLLQYDERTDEEIAYGIAKDKDYVGCVRTGELCFDFVVREYDGKAVLDFDLYVGGIDNGYGYSRVEPNYPYTYYGGGSLFGFSWDYDEFRQEVEHTLTDFIHELNITDKAMMPLHVW